jgi:anaerobic selenocysteine-containing dehydrogenase
MTKRARYRPYEQPTGGWGSVKSLVKHATRQRALSSVVGLVRDHNKTGGYMCTSCAWAKPGKPHVAEFCENGAKATFWDLTSKRTTPEFFARHTVSELLGWSDYDLENEGRLTHPMRYDAASDRYVPVSWEDAFADIGAKLQSYAPESVVFYASGRASLETSYMYQLLARLYGNNNLPDSSNMCHETTSVALPEHRHAGRHRAAGGFRQDRLHILLRPECRHQFAPVASRPSAGARARRAHRRLQSPA